jgi:hypothetical protein
MADRFCDCEVLRSKLVLAQAALRLARVRIRGLEAEVETFDGERQDSAWADFGTVQKVAAMGLDGWQLLYG